jgi:purine-cytosine permease-like protein
VIASGLLVGSGMWGNEPDIYRYAKARPWFSVPALLVGYIVLVLFAVAGYLMAEISSASQFGAIVSYFVGFSLFGLTAVATIVFFVNQFALNDGNLYEGINAMQNIFVPLSQYWKFPWRRTYSVLILGAIGAVVAVLMVNLQNNFFIVAGISGIFVPCATTIMVMDVFAVPRLFGLRRPVHKLTAWHEAAGVNWVGLIALVIALIFGAYTGGLIPGIATFGTNIGFPTLQSWALGAVLYLLGVWAVQRNPQRYRLLGYPKGYEAGEPSSGLAPAPAG